MNKRVLITGGGRGIGAATARHLAGLGYHLCLNYRHDQASAEALVAEIQASHPVRCIAVQADVGVEAEVVRLFEDSRRWTRGLAPSPIWSTTPAGCSRRCGCWR